MSAAVKGVAAVVGRPHATKGEELVLLTSDAAVTTEGVREAVRAKGLSDINIPKRIRVCSPFPLLGSGKPDLVALQQLAETAESAAA